MLARLGEQGREKNFAFLLLTIVYLEDKKERSTEKEKMAQRVINSIEVMLQNRKLLTNYGTTETRPPPRSGALGLPYFLRLHPPSRHLSHISLGRCEPVLWSAAAALHARCLAAQPN